MKTAVIYSRVSSSGYQSNRQDTSRQVEDLIKYADFANLDVKKIYEEHISGAKKQKPVLDEAIEFCKQGHINTLLVSELSRVGRNAFEVLATVKDLVDHGINLYLQKEQLNLLDCEGKPTIFAPIMIATLSTCAELERENIKFRLQSGRQKYVSEGGRLGRKVGSVKSKEQKAEEYRDIISYLKKGYSVRVTAKLSDRSISTVQRVKKEFHL